MSSNPELSDELELLQRRWNGITDIPAVPRSTMDVIEYGLGKQQRAEVYVNRLLSYLLDPTQPHRMGTDFVAAFLDGLPADCGFEEDTYDLSDVRVNDQVPVWKDPEAKADSNTSPGYVDLVLDVPNEWILVIELKFSAAETGTEFYCTASQYDDELIDEYESGQYYLYLHQADQPEASGDCFTNWTWTAFISDVLTDFIADNTPHYPQRTVTQLHDLKDDVQNIAGMSQQHDINHEKVALYLDHYDAITDVVETFDDEWEAYSQRWGQDLRDSLTEDTVRSAQNTDDGHPAVTVPRDDRDGERWLFRDNGGDWQHVFKHGWVRREHEPEILEQRANDTNDLRIGFYHRMSEGSNKHVAISDRELRFNFRCMGSNPTTFRDIYNDNFDDKKSVIEDALSGTNAVTTGNKRTMIRGTYSIDTTESGDFFNAYTTALHNAFVDLVVENEELVRLLTAVFEDSIEQYR